jgi:predicted RNA-binding protein (virulence factor B family)
VPKISRDLKESSDKRGTRFHFLEEDAGKTWALETNVFIRPAQGRETKVVVYCARRDGKLVGSRSTRKLEIEQKRMDEILGLF